MEEVELIHFKEIANAYGEYLKLLRSYRVREEYDWTNELEHMSSIVEEKIMGLAEEMDVVL